MNAGASPAPAHPRAAPAGPTRLLSDSRATCRRVSEGGDFAGEEATAARWEAGRPYTRPAQVAEHPLAVATLLRDIGGRG